MKFLAMLHIPLNRLILGCLLTLSSLPVFSQQYNGGYIPDEIEDVSNPLHSPLSKEREYEIPTHDPYKRDDKPVKLNTPSQQEKEEDPVAAAFEKFSKQPASEEARIAPVYVPTPKVETAEPQESHKPSTSFPIAAILGLGIGMGLLLMFLLTKLDVKVSFRKTKL